MCSWKIFSDCQQSLDKGLAWDQVDKGPPWSQSGNQPVDSPITATISISYHFSILGAEPRNVNHGNGGSRGGGGGQRKGQEKGNL